MSGDGRKADVTGPSVETDHMSRARAMAASFQAVLDAFGDEANDDARASERTRIVSGLDEFNAHLAAIGRGPVMDREGGVPALRHISLVRAMNEAVA